MRHTLALEGMNCDSCGKIIRRAAEENGASVESIDAAQGLVIIECDEQRFDGLKKSLAEKGFPEKGAAGRGDPGRLLRYAAAVLAGDSNVRAESRLLNYSLGTAIFMLGAGSVAYLLLKGSDPSGAYLPLLVLAAATSMASVYSYKHMSCYREGLSCSNSMMIGMTLGMITGFMAGAIVGATNGMFVGSAAGMAVGITLGGNAGRFGGVMGAMEGVMAGLMSGLMGAMTSVMLVNDNLVALLYILFGICTFVLGGLSYMMHREGGAADDCRAGSVWEFLMAATLLSAMMALLMLFGPRGPVTYP